MKQIVLLANNLSGSSLKYLHGKRKFLTYRIIVLEWLLLKFFSTPHSGAF
jgi:hypothetical protein